MAAVAGAALALLMLAAAPAWAHGGTPDASNYRSTVTGVARLVEGAPGGGVTAPSGVTWRILGADALLQLDNTGDDDIVVMGYSGEPFLRVGPAGVFENRRSPATYLNAERFAQVDVPEEADAEAEPQWRQVSSEARWQWHDHRIHWMGSAPPPRVQERPGTPQTVLEWFVPFRVSGRDLAITGVLRWIPPGPVWPWLVGAVAAVSVPVVVLLVAGGAARRATRALVVVTAAVAVAGVVVALGDAVATPATIGADAWAVTQAAVPAGVAIALAGSLWRLAPDGDGSNTPLLVAAAVVAVGGGVARLAQLQSSQIVNALPSWTVRATVAASLALVVPAALMMLPAVRRREEGS